jgi:8-oxo-dGTP pyrophosphatase MutT (NUDIX family)
MPDPEFEIPSERLPPGFAQSVERAVTAPAEPKPAATIVLMRDGANGLEVLLLKRHRSSGFVPGAYVFPGGRTDEADADPALAALTLNAHTADVPPHFWFGAVREVFEEAGVLLARDQRGEWVADTTSAQEMQALRLALLEEELTLADVIRRCNCRLDFAGIVYFAHWITPLAEPRRYDTRFFAARLPAQREVRHDPREMTDAIWLTPADALARFSRGELPLVFPTVRTLEQLVSFSSTEAALAHLRATEVEPVLPRLVRTATGVGIVIDPK